jgi:hypothetical protein
MKRHGGRQEKERQERRAAKQKQHDHSYFAWPAPIVEVLEPIRAPSYINASQPSRAAPIHSSVASFGKNGIEYRKFPCQNDVSKLNPIELIKNWTNLLHSFFLVQ